MCLLDRCQYRCRRRRAQALSCFDYHKFVLEDVVRGMYAAGVCAWWCVRGLRGAICARYAWAVLKLTFGIGVPPPGDKCRRIHKFTANDAIFAHRCARLGMWRISVLMMLTIWLSVLRDMVVVCRMGKTVYSHSAVLAIRRCSNPLDMRVFLLQLFFAGKSSPNGGFKFDDSLKQIHYWFYKIVTEFVKLTKIRQNNDYEGCDDGVSFHQNGIIDFGLENSFSNVIIN